MLPLVTKKMKKLWKKLLKAWTKHQPEKAVKLQQKLINEELKLKRPKK